MSNEQPAEKKQSFWTTLPGIITALSGLVVAITGLVTVIINNSGPSSANPTPTSSETAIVEETNEPTATTATEPTDTPTETPEEVAQGTEAPTPTVALEHVTIPEEPGNNPSWFVDSSSEVYANEGQATADDFLNNPLERPFTAESMNYLGYLDVNRVEISSVRAFIYVAIGVEETPPQDAVANYGVEIDTDMDGRGDWLIYAELPPSTDWTVEGVRVYYDSDNNVGGPSPLISNPGIQGNGYETVLFDSGFQTTDPDFAWVRRSPSRGNFIEFAFKPALIDNNRRFLWSGWADAGPMEPGWFEYNDHFTLEEAGSPLASSPEYPLKGLAQVDNTCRWPYGFNPRGDEPGLCP